MHGHLSSEEIEHHSYGNSIADPDRQPLEKALLYTIYTPGAIVLPCKCRDSIGESIEGTHGQLLDLHARGKAGHVDRAQTVIGSLHDHRAYGRYRKLQSHGNCHKYKP